MGDRQRDAWPSLMRSTVGRLALCSLLGIVALLCLGGPALAANGPPRLLPSGSAPSDGSGYYVTFVARSCPDYTDIFANKARNNILESLKDLGPDSQYTTEGDLVNPTTESSPPQDICQPITSWQFTLGTGIESRAVTGPWGSLSKVTDPYSTAINTDASTPLLDQNAKQIDHETLDGATTIELTNAQRQQANTGSQLWAQGGTPTDPVLATPFPGPEFGFGALRCATDDLNGDNVEYIYFPAGVTHVFCYGIYVKPPPTSGLITIKKKVVDAPANTTPSFPFNGDLSFDPNGFNLSDGQSMDFYRAGQEPGGTPVTWNVAEAAVDRYRLTGVDCTATTPSGGPGSSTVDVSGSMASIHLVALEHVTCVVTNQYVPPVGGLTIQKITRGGVGTFRYTLTPASGGDRHRLRATTTDPGVPAVAQPSLAGLEPGTYTIRERAPRSLSGRWRPLRVVCEGVQDRARGPVTVEIHSGENTTCTFVNGFIPRGSISVSKISRGNTGTFAFLMGARNGEAAQYLQHATTTTQGEAADAVPASPSDATDHLPLGRYLIVEQLPVSDPLNAWAVTSVQCNGVLQPFDRGTVEVRLTREDPSVHCTYTDTFTDTPPPIPPPPNPPTPPTPPTPPAPPVYEQSDLVVTKKPSAHTVIKGQAVSYRITVTNRGPDAAQRVMLDEQLPRGTTLVSVHSPVGQCKTKPQVTCSLGTLNRGAQVVVTVRLIAQRVTSKLINRVVVGTSTSETNVANNAARAVVRVKAPPPPPPPPPGLG
jgi:uncharacterized repeat protein (TIGR01451 family)